MIYVMRYIFKGHVVDQFGTMLDRNWKGGDLCTEYGKGKIEPELPVEETE